MANQEIIQKTGIFIFGLISFLLLISCSKLADFTPTHNLTGNGYAIDYYKNMHFPNLTISVAENAKSSNQDNATYATIPRGIISIDSNGHFNFNIKVYDISSEFDFQIVNYPNYLCTGTTSTYFNSSSSANFNFLIVPSGITALSVLDSDINKFDSIRIDNPYYRKNIISWKETIALPGHPPPHLYINPLKISVLPSSSDTITWIYYKYGQPYLGKEIDYKQANGQNSNFTLSF